MAKSYTAARSGFILGIWYEQGAPVPLSESQAKYLAPPFGTDLVPPGAVKPTSKPAAPKASPKPESANKD